VVLRWWCCFFRVQLQAFALSTFDLHFGGTGTLQMQDTLPNGPFAIEDGVQYPNLPRDGHLNDQRRHGTFSFSPFQDCSSGFPHVSKHGSSKRSGQQRSSTRSRLLAFQDTMSGGYVAARLMAVRLQVGR